MPSCEWMENEVLSFLPNASVVATDLTGGGDHFHLRVVDSTFEDIRTLARQRVILSHFKQYIPHTVHALDIQALAPSQAQSTEASVFHPHGEGKGIHIKSIERQLSKRELE